MYRRFICCLVCIGWTLVCTCMVAATTPARAADKGDANAAAAAALEAIGAIPLLPYPASGTHKVVKGDTLYNISKRYQVPMTGLIERNRLKKPYTIRIGQTLELPPPTAHVVAKGETLYSISRRWSVKVEELSKLNQLPKPYTIYIGQALTLPAMIKAVPIPPPTKTSSKPVNLTPPKRSSSKFIWPVSGKLLSSFGPKKGGLRNDGINISAKRGVPFKAADNGVVAYTGTQVKGYGNLVLIKHADNWVTAYAHADSLSVKKGDRVKVGQVIGTVGSTGNVSTPQLHFEIRKKNKAVNPLSYMKK